MAASARPCKFGSSFRRRGCGREAVSECVYCTRPFCEKHGERGEDYTHVCAGRRCREKLANLRKQTEWRARVAGSNQAKRVRHRGMPGADASPVLALPAAVLPGTRPLAGHPRPLIRFHGGPDLARPRGPHRSTGAGRPAGTAPAICRRARPDLCPLRETSQKVEPGHGLSRRVLRRSLSRSGAAREVARRPVLGNRIRVRRDAAPARQPAMHVRRDGDRLSGERLGGDGARGVDDVRPAGLLGTG